MATAASPAATAPPAGRLSGPPLAAAAPGTGTAIPARAATSRACEYSYAFSTKLQQEWNWTERYRRPAEILRYANHRRRPLRPAPRHPLRHPRHRATFDDEAARAGRSTTEHAATALAAPFVHHGDRLPVHRRIPDIPGRRHLQGRSLHTGRWPHEGVDFSGQRVGVIGTGSSGIQSIPVIARAGRAPDRLPAHAQLQPAGAQRAARPRVRAALQGALSRDQARGGERQRHSFYPQPQRNRRAPRPRPRASASATRRAGRRAAPASCAPSPTSLIDKEANDTAAEFVREKIRAIVRDPRVADLLTPKDHPIGTKRLCLDTGYYETYNRDNVTLVDVRTAPIVEITEKGVRTTEREYELDAIVFATGFDAMTGALPRSTSGAATAATLRDAWARTARDLSRPDGRRLPEPLHHHRPRQPVGAEQHDGLDRAARRLDHRLHRPPARQHDAPSRPTPEAARTLGRARQRGRRQTLYPRPTSWYLGANIPGKPRVFMPYAGGMAHYRRLCAEVAADNYRGFARS